MTAHTHIEPTIFPNELMALMGIKHPNTLRLHIQAGKIPPPDVQISQKTRYWWASTLVKAGLIPGRGNGGNA